MEVRGRQIYWYDFIATSAQRRTSIDILGYYLNIVCNIEVFVVGWDYSSDRI